MRPLQATEIARMRATNEVTMTETITPRYSGGTRTPVKARISLPSRAPYGQGEFVTQLQDVIEVAIPYDAVIQKGDTFTYDGFDWEVVTLPVLATNGIERRFTAETG